MVTCIPAMLRVEIELTPYRKIIVVLQFPPNYPKEPILVELKSKHLAAKLLDGLTVVIEKELKSVLPKPQAMWTIKFVAKFLEETPLCVCSDEIAKVTAMFLMLSYLVLFNTTLHLVI